MGACRMGRPEPKRCEICGEWIRFPVPRRMPDGRVMIVCSECSEDPAEQAPKREHVKDRAALHDMEYHGGRFHAGEW